MDIYAEAKKLTSINEEPIGGMLKKQRSITSLHPPFYDRVKAVGSAGGIDLYKEKAGLWHFKVASATTPGKKYDIYVQFSDMAKQIQDKVRDRRLWNKDQTKIDLRKLAKAILQDANVKINCSCPANLYWGGAYIQTQRGSKYGDQENRPPKVRNPRRYGFACKHCQLMFDVLPFYKGTLAGHIKRFFMPEIRAMEAASQKEVGAVKTAAAELRAREKPAPKGRAQAAPSGQESPSESVQEARTPFKPATKQEIVQRAKNTDDWEWHEDQRTGEAWARNVKTGRSISKEEDSEEWGAIFGSNESVHKYQFSIGGDGYDGDPITYKGRVVGGVAVDYDMPIPEITGIKIQPEYRHKGLAKKAIMELLVRHKKFYVRSIPLVKKFWEKIGVVFDNFNADAGLWEGYLTDKSVKEGVEVADPDTEIEPEVAPGETEPKRRNPLAPTPGVTPKPKAKRDIDLFVQSREGMQEAHIAHPSKVSWIQSGDPTLNKMLPDLSPEEETYLMKIAGEEYLDLVSKIESYTGLKVQASNLPSLAQLLMQSLQKAQEIEQKNKHYFEEWAVMLPLQMEEFKMVEKAVTTGDLKIDAKLEEPDLSAHFSTQPEEDGLSQAEELNQDIFDELKEIEATSPEAIQRRFANLLISGGASQKLYLFNMIKDKLESVDKTLPTIYGILASLAQLGYWVAPEGLEKAAAAGDEEKAGSEEVIPEGDTYTIKARATTFPYLVHEVVKGIYEWLSLNKEHEPEMKGEDIGSETRDMLAGPSVFKKFLAYIPANKQYLTPLVQKYAVKLSPDEIRSVLDGSGTGRMIMNRLIGQAEADWGEYEKSRGA